MSMDRARGLLRLASVERRELARLRARVGLRAALAERARAALGIEHVLATADRTDVAVQQLTGEVLGTQASVARVHDHLRRVADAAEHDGGRIVRLERHLTYDPTEIETLRLTSDVELATRWVERLPPSEALVSVILPTHDRPQLLREAIESVLSQSHQHFELIVVDDASGPETAMVLATLTDPRIRCFRRERNGFDCAARNIGLAHARGQYVAYLDDDNLIGAAWLRGLIWAFESHPECDLVYGAMLHDATTNRDGWPICGLMPWNRQRLLLGNLMDQGTIAHRAGMPEARYDEGIRGAADWEFVVRMTAERDAVAVPIVAVHYRTRQDDRISNGEPIQRDIVRAQQRFARRGPLRILVLDAVHPVAGASPEPLAAELERQGDHVVRADRTPGVDGRPAAWTLEALRETIRTVRPDLVLTTSDPDVEARLRELFTAYVALAPGGTGEDDGERTTSLGRWDGREPFGIVTGGVPLRTALLGRLDVMHARWRDAPAPEPLPGDVRFPVVDTHDEPGLVTVVRDATAEPAPPVFD